MKTKRKVVVVGDSNVGKTSLIYQMVNKTMFPYSHFYTVFHMSTVEVKVKNKEIELELEDTVGADDFSRPLRYLDTDVVIMVYSIDSALRNDV